jgi:serine/threonine protein kinase
MHTIENFARETNETVSQVELNWQWRIDAVVCGECREDDFIDELSSLWKADPDSAWNVIALLNQRYRRGQIPVDLFRSIEFKIAQGGMGAVDYGMTIILDLVLATQRDVPIHTSDVLTLPGLGDHMHPDASAPQATPLKTPQVRMEDRSASSVPEIGRVLRNRYVLESRLGSGGMGTVFKAMDRYRCDLPEDNRHVAIKFLHEDIDSRPEVLWNLRREFYCAQALSHRSIVKVYELDRDDDVAFFTMELLEGELLSSVLERSYPFSISRSYAWAIILEIGDGLAHAHARNVVHGDLKPKNIMITNSGELRILDFGASHAPAHQHSNADGARKSTINITPAYACCELFEGQQGDPRDDLYALACLSYELLAGEHPFQGRRSTEARDLGLMARRPPGLTRQQWQTLAMGFSWRREGRAISVRDWVAKLNPGEATARPLARLLDLGRAISVRDWVAKLDPSRAVAPRLARLRDLGRAISVCDWVAKLNPGPAVAPRLARLRDLGRAISVCDWVAKLNPGPAVAPRLARLRDLGRAISVCDWVAKLDPRRAAARRLARLLARNSERSFQLRVPSSRVIALFAILLVSLTVWISFNRLSFERKISGNFSVPNTAANTLIYADPVTHLQNLLLDGKLLPGSESMRPPLPDILSRERPTLQKVTFAVTTKSDAARTALHKEKLNKIRISADTHTIGSREHFAEIHVRRSSGFDGNTTFVWWTEPSSAKPGIDYVPQTPVTQLLPKGRHLASLFIRIIPNASRKHSAMFYVTIADPSNGTTVGHLARTAILLPPSS